MQNVKQKERNSFLKMNNPEVIYEDDNVIILDKPSGWITNLSSSVTNQPVVESWLSENFRYQISESKLYRSGIVHRIDKETSGLLIVAKNKTSFKNLQKQFKQRVIHKTYKALVHGKLKEPEGVVNLPVGRLPWNRKRFGVMPGGRVSETKYKTVGVYLKGSEKYSFVRVNPKTGRTHQIRIHFKYLGHPLVGDEFYAGRKTSRNDRLWCPRLFLHASKISFLHPVTNKRSQFISKLPKELKDILRTLTKEN